MFLVGTLLTLPMFSQPTRTKNDPKQIFSQDFEVKQQGLTGQEAYNLWSTTPVDTIHFIEYYSRLGTGTPSSSNGGKDIYDGSAQWEIFAVRTDSTTPGHEPGAGIIMYNGVEPSSSKTDIENKNYKDDLIEIVNDGGDDSRKQAFAKYGEDGGDYFFRYTTSDLSKKGLKSSDYTKDTRSTAKHRRDMYVRGLDVDDHSSYRLTFYIKTTKLNTWGPLLYADVMRGYHHQREAFSMGYKSGKAYEYKTDEFKNNTWERVTLMTYYIDDHEADAYVFYKGSYSWYDRDDWRWRPSDEMLQALGKTLKEGDSLNYVKQPDKFFVRISFSTDSIEYCLDNLSLTKSWIGGCEYDKDKMRVNFGYETNIKDIVAKEYAKTNIPLVEIKDVDEKYFEVWCLKKGGVSDNPDDWEPMPIRTAEYHDDGYMYMFTAYGPNQQPFYFEDYDSVLVTFHNPVDQEGLALQYTGSTYPQPEDTAWVKAGKYVPSFYNEVATPNPIAFDNVIPFDMMPPILQKAQYEEGSFGLPSDTRTLKFKFHRAVRFDDKGKTSDFVIAYVGNELWEPSWNESESSLVITRPADKQTPLTGDKEIKISQIMGIGTMGESAPLTFHYHFGSFDTNPQEPAKLYGSDWRSELTDKNLQECVPASTWVNDSYKKSGQPTPGDNFKKGDNGAASFKTCLFLLGYDSNDLDNCGFYICSRQKKSKGDTYTGNMWTIVDFAQPGDYVIKFKACAYIEQIADMVSYLRFYPQPDKDANTLTYADFNGVAKKDTLGTIIPTTVISKDNAKSGTAKWPVGVDVYEFDFNVPAAGKYVFEWVNFYGTSTGNGVMIGNYSISNKAADDLSVKYVKKLLNAVNDAQTKLAAVTDVKYEGADLNALATAKNEAAAYVGNFPSQYDSVVANVNAMIQALNVRIDTVDAFCAKEEEVATKLAAIKGDSLNMIAYKALKQHKDANANLVLSTKTTSQLNAEIKAYDAEIEAIDTHFELMDKFAAKLKETKALIDAKDARADYTEYGTMQAGYNTALGVDIITPSDDDVIAATNALITAKNVYQFKYDYYIAKTRQVKELYALADTLGYDFAGFGGKKDSIKSLIDALEDDHAALSKVLREASILQILKIYKENDAAKVAKLKNLNVSALIPNYYLYNEAQIGRNIEKNSSGNWRIIKDVADNTAIPGWTLKATSGNMYFTTAKAVKEDYTIDDYTDWEVDGHVFIGGLKTATSSKGILSTEITGLPHAYYKVGLYCYNGTSDLVYDFKGVRDTTAKVLTLNGGNKNRDYIDLMLDSVLVNDTLVYKIDQQSSSSEEFDLRGAVLRLSAPDAEFDYSDAVIAAHELKLNEAITIVDAPKAVADNVEYFTLSGIKLAAPRSGEILIRKTTRGGKVIVDKVLIR